MTTAPALAVAAATLGVLGAWELIAALEATRPAAVLARALEPVVRAGREGRSATAPERRRLALVAAGGLAAAGWLLGGVALGVVAAVAGPALARAGLLARRRAYRRELVRAAPAVARSLADALAAGHAVRGAVAAAADGVAGPARVELRRAAAALALGEPTGAALETLRTRAGAAPWDAMVAGILLQRDAGGDLTGLLRDLAESLEATVRAERDARAATAQARATARTVAGLPVAAAVLAELARPGFLSGLVATPLSAALVALSAVLQLAGAAAVRALARVGR